MKHNKVFLRHIFDETIFLIEVRSQCIIKSFSERVCSENLFLRYQQRDVESLWNEMIFPLMEAVSTILPKRWAPLSSEMD